MTGRETLFSYLLQEADSHAKKCDAELLAGYDSPNQLRRVSASLTRRLAAEVEILAQALEPFLRATNFYTANTDNDYTLHVKGEDIRRAREALGWDE